MPNPALLTIFQNALFPLADASAVDSQITGGAFAGVTVDNDGTVLYQTLFSSVNLGPWVVPQVLAGSYWCRITGGSGNAPAGSALNTWLACSSDRAWSLTQTGVGSKSYSATLQFASDAAGANIVASVPFYLEASVAA